MMDKRRIISMLCSVYDKKIEDYEDLVNVLNALKINSLVNYLVYHDSDYTDEDRELMSIIIKLLQNIYNNGSVLSPISDELYDKLYASMLSAGSDDIVGADTGSDRIVVYHQYPDLRGTLDKVHFFTRAERGKDKRKSIEDWYNSIINIMGRRLTQSEGMLYVFPKFDGVSVIFECDKNGNVERALTRGDTVRNEANLIPLLHGMKFTPNDDWRGSPFGVKTEVVMTFSNYKKFCKKYGDYKSPRSAVSSIVNAQEIKLDFLRYITIVPLRMQNFTTGETIIHPDAMNVYPFIEMNIEDSDMKEKFYNLRDYMSDVFDIPCDGVVLHIIDKDIQSILGRDDAINNFEVAYKFPPIGVKTHLLGVAFSIGTLGSLAPVAKIEPVVMNGNTIKNVSLGSIDRFESLSLRVGDEVIIKYEIIPYLEKDPTCLAGDGELIPTPTHCMYCGEELVLSPILKCENPTCPCRMIGSIVNYLNKMDIMNISEGIVTSLFDLGVLRSIEDLYTLNKHRNVIINTPGFGSKSFEKILKGIKARSTVKDYELLGSLGIPNVEKKKFKAISFIYYIDELQDICNAGDVKSLTCIPGIGEKTASTIIVGMLKNEELIEFLKHELTIVPTKGVDSNVSILFSKVKDKGKFEKFLSSKGFDIASGYNKNVSLLIVPSHDVTSTKIERAKKDGKEIITLEEACARFGFNG